jgi:type IV pilus assembly protein PilA
MDLKLILSCLLLMGIGIGTFAALTNAIRVRHQQRTNKRQAGFSLIELLIVVSVILIIAALAIPALLQSKMRANEASATGSLRTILVAETTYNNLYGTYSPNLTSLGNSDVPGCTPAPATACIIDGLLAQDPANKSGYLISFVGDGNTPSVDYFILAVPASPGYSGQNQFCAGSDSVLREDPSNCTIASAPMP